MKRCYVATYPLNQAGNDLVETVLLRDSYYSPAISDCFERLIVSRKQTDPMVQCWYSDEYAATCMATTNQPYLLA